MILVKPMITVHRTKQLFNYFKHALNNTTPTIYFNFKGSNGKKIKDKEAIEAANFQIQRIKAEFKNWVFADVERTKFLVDLYNEEKNRLVLRKYKTPKDFQLEGMNAEVKLRRHQKDAIWRSTQQRNVMMTHDVGAGKTMAAFGRIQARKQLGLCKKQ